MRHQPDRDIVILSRNFQLPRILYEVSSECLDGIEDVDEHAVKDPAVPAPESHNTTQAKKVQWQWCPAKL